MLFPRTQLFNQNRGITWLILFFWLYVWKREMRNNPKPDFEGGINISQNEEL